MEFVSKDQAICAFLGVPYNEFAAHRFKQQLRNGESDICYIYDNQKPCIVSNETIRIDPLKYNTYIDRQRLSEIDNYQKLDRKPQDIDFLNGLFKYDNPHNEVMYEHLVSISDMSTISNRYLSKPQKRRIFRTWCAMSL